MFLVFSLKRSFAYYTYTPHIFRDEERLNLPVGVYLFPRTVHYYYYYYIVINRIVHTTKQRRIIDR